MSDTFISWLKIIKKIVPFCGKPGQRLPEVRGFEPQIPVPDAFISKIDMHTIANQDWMLLKDLSILSM